MFTRISRFASGLRSRPSSSQRDTKEQISLAEMNNLLQILAEVFPEHQVSLLRELLLDASQESRLHIAANALVQSPEQYASRVARLLPGRLEEWEKFRSTRYTTTVEKLLITEFQGLANSTIRNVVSENNGDYLRSREALVGVASKSWRLNFMAYFSRNPAPLARPLLDVTRKSTGCARLDEEIYALGRPERDAQTIRDEQLAKAINEDEHVQARALLECECCFGDFTWEDITACTDGHFFCHGCLASSVKEALFGQGGYLHQEKGSVRCISSAAVACGGFVPSALLSHALSPELLDRLEQRFARDQLRSSGLHLVRCPNCNFAVIDTSSSTRLRSSAMGLLAILAIFIAGLIKQYYLLIWKVGIHLLLFHFLCRTLGEPSGVSFSFRATRVLVINAMARAKRRSMGVRQVFTCKNLRCGLTSCIDCGRTWTAFHNCYREALDNQRLYIERAMSEAVKRTCPQCCTSFLKSGGCNLLTCPCGYEMCYICRADVRGTRYKHFCQHFRLRPGQPCTECDHCNLYETEDEKTVVNAAAQRAASEWATRRSAGNLGNSEDQTIRNATHVEPWRRTDNKVLSWVEQRLEGMIELIFEW